MTSHGLAPSICLALSLAAIVIPAAASGQSPHPLSVHLSGAEFPDYDAEVLRQQRNGLANASLSVRLRQQLGLPELADALALRRGDDALRVLQSIVRNAPQDIPRAFEIIAYRPGALSDQARGYPDALQALDDEARKQLPGLPRELEARAARALLTVDQRQHSTTERPTFADMLANFVKDYQGTEASLLAEVDVI